MTANGNPPPVAAHREAIADRLVRSNGLLIGLDFDGTLAPIAVDPDQPTITEPCRRALERLASRQDVTAAVISGRALEDLYDRVGLTGVVYAGNHGLELDSGAGTVVHPIAARHRPALRQILDEIPRRLRGLRGWEIEDKGLSATVHVRQMPAQQADEVRAVLEAAAEAADAPFRVSRGKAVYEIRPAVDWDKGSAIRLLADDTPDDWHTLYLGDDVTDDDAFRAVQPPGLGILVGPPRDTDADYRLPDQSSVAPFLGWLIERVLDRQATTRS